MEPGSPRKWFFPSIFVIPHLDYCVQFYASQYKPEYWHNSESKKGYQESGTKEYNLWEKAEKTGFCSILQRGGKGRILLLSSTAQQKIVEKTKLNFFSECTGKQDVLGTGCNKLNSHYKSGNESQETVEQPAQRRCGIVSILGDAQNLPGHSPEESEINLPCFKHI